MMGPYTHFVLAKKLETYIQPENLEEYYWGAVIPDIRYLARMRRSQTHLSLEDLKRLFACYPHLKAFLQGYQVHCLIDQVDTEKLIASAFPLNILRRVARKRLNQQQAAMLVEMYYLRTGGTKGKLAGSHNEVLNDLGIAIEQTSQFFQAMQTYIDSHSFDTAITTFQQIGMIENARIDKYLQIYRSMENKKLLNAILMVSVKNARLDRQVIEHVQTNCVNL